MDTDNLQKQKKITIAFPYMGGNLWTFGNVYQSDLIKSLQKYGPDNYIFIVLVPRSQMGTIAETNPGVSYVYYEDYKIELMSNLLTLAYNAVMNLFGKKAGFSVLLKKHHVDVLFGPLIDFPIFNIKTLIWIPDFQHIHFPEMFSPDECQSRSSVIRNVAKKATRVVLISDAVKKDFDNFAPEYSKKAAVFPPLAYIEDSVYDMPPDVVLKRYNLPEKFIFLPNQFWKHKNHCLVLQAIRLLREQGILVTLVCAGSAHDYRNPTFFSLLLRKISEWDLRDNVIYLGLIPHDDVLLLIRQSVCVINPSLFEGFGFSVDEARSVGKKLILSDIPPHREQNAPAAEYFDPSSKEDLARIIRTVWSETPPGPDAVLEQNARKDYRHRVQKNIQTFNDLISDVMNK
jgi:glycosyltransferase involved in cell wall biosynthesis